MILNGEKTQFSVLSQTRFIIDAPKLLIEEERSIAPIGEGGFIVSSFGLGSGQSGSVVASGGLGTYCGGNVGQSLNGGSNGDSIGNENDGNENDGDCGGVNVLDQLKSVLKKDCTS
eukprot:TRINITY_DN2005_c1_g5_i2.p2 TRINITY_DN2005_c1_g5~~TRINITY_DN2005_c1_g5_i2.p2  ORF type:complete len:116 (+),score=21.86 TRINITY_DN2005_c1_g5_i2:196-543(+)